MSAMVINSSDSLQRAIGDLRDLWNRHKFLRLSVKAGKDRSIPQNAITHVWYEQLARELREDDASAGSAIASCTMEFRSCVLKTKSSAPITTQLSSRWGTSKS